MHALLNLCFAECMYWTWKVCQHETYMTFVFLIIHGPIAKAFATAFVIILSAFASAMNIFLWGWIFNSFCKLVKFTCEDLSKRVFLHSSLVTRGKASLDLLRTKRAALPKSSVAYHLSDIWSRCQLPTIIINIMIIYVSESFFRNCWKWQMLFAHLKL